MTRAVIHPISASLCSTDTCFFDGVDGNGNDREAMISGDRRALYAECELLEVSLFVRTLVR